jgi:TolB protein
MNNLIFLLLSVILIYPQENNIGIFEKSSDVGNCKITGNAIFDPATNVYTIKGSGKNIWGASDEFHFLWIKISDNFSLSAHISFEGKGVNLHRKMGIMIRESLEKDSPYADVVVHGDGLTSLQYRLAKGEITKEMKAEINGADNILIQRIANKVITKRAIEKEPSHVTGEIIINLPDTCYVGLFIGSHDENVTETGYFNDVILLRN